MSDDSDSALRLAAVRAVVNEQDPIGLLELGAPEDEYDPEVGDLAELEVPITAQEVIGVFLRWFGSTTGRIEPGVAERIADGINAMGDVRR